MLAVEFSITTLYLLGAMVVVAVSLITYALWPKSTDEDDAIKRRMAGSSAQSNVARVRAEAAKKSVTKKMRDQVRTIAVKPAMVTNAEEMSKLRIKLANAGIRSERAPVTFLASKTVVAVLLAIAAAVFCWVRGEPMVNALGVVLLGAGLGFMAPNIWLCLATSQRADLIRKGLPDSLDMMVISVESGLGLDAALQRVGEELCQVHPALSEEMQIVTLESQMGIPRAEALHNFATRCGLDEARSLVGVINQAERFGTSIAQALRRQSQALRVKRRQAAEEKAQQTTVKLMFPLICFIFPAILVVLAGPAGLKAMEMFNK